MIAAGLYGVDHELPLEPAFAGNAYTDDGSRVPTTLRDALELWRKSELAQAAFGSEVVEHYANAARVEIGAFDAAVTDWELHRSFERMSSHGELRSGYLHVHVHGAEPGHRGPGGRGAADSARSRPMRRSPGRPRPSAALAGGGRPGTGPRCCAAFADVVDAHIEELALLEVAGSGHPVGQARWEAGNVRDVLRYYSAAPERLLGQQIPVPGGLNVTFKEPVGIVGLIVPWNFPMPILGWGLGPALAAGNPVIAKPAERTPLTAIRIGELALEAGLPEGVFQVLPGKGSVVGQRLVEHPRSARSSSPDRPRWAAS